MKLRSSYITIFIIFIIYYIHIQKHLPDQGTIGNKILFALKGLADTQNHDSFARFRIPRNYSLYYVERRREAPSRRFMKQGTRRLHFPWGAVFSFHFQTYFHPGWKRTERSPRRRLWVGRKVPRGLQETAIIRSATRKSISTASGINLASHLKRTRPHLPSHPSGSFLALSFRGGAVLEIVGSRLRENIGEVEEKRSLSMALEHAASRKTMGGVLPVVAGNLLLLEQSAKEHLFRWCKLD